MKMSHVYTLPHRRPAAINKPAEGPRACVEDIHGAWGLF